MMGCCEVDEGSGYYIIAASDHSEEYPPGDDGYAAFVFVAEPGSWEFWTEGWSMVWTFLQHSAGANPGPLCYVQTMDGWPALAAVFECSSGVSDYGEGLPVEMVEGIIECP